MHTFIIDHGQEEAESEEATRVIVPHRESIHQDIKEHCAGHGNTVMRTEAFGRGRRRSLVDGWRETSKSQLYDY